MKKTRQLSVYLFDNSRWSMSIERDERLVIFIIIEREEKKTKHNINIDQVVEWEGFFFS